jgi:hypothetical protein
MTSSQQTADHLLSIWQASRELPPEERMEILMADFFSPLLPCEAKYEATLHNVALEMAA